MTAAPFRSGGARALAVLALLVGLVAAALSVPTVASAEAAAAAAAGANDVEALAYSPDGTKLAVGARDSRILVYQPDTGTLLRSLPGHARAPVAAVAFSPDGKVIASAGRDSTVRVWDATTGAQLRVLMGHEEPVRALAFSPDGGTLVSGGDDTKAIVWDLATGRIRDVLTGNGDFVTAVTFSPDGTSFATATRGGRIRLWDAGKLSVKRLLLGHQREVTSLAFAPDGTTLASGSADTTVRLWSVSTGSTAKTLRGQTGSMTGLSFRAGGAILASGNTDGTVGLWDTSTGALRARLGTADSPVQATAFNPSGKSLVEGRKDALVRTWDASTLKAIRSWYLPGPTSGTAATTSGTASRTLSAASSTAADSPTSAALPASTTSAAELAAGPGGPILVVTDAADPFSTYYPEILRAEGLNSFSTADIATLTAGDLAAYDVVVLAAHSLTAAGTAMFSDWVTGGGNLAAMRPDAQLAGLLGITSAGGALPDAYLKVDTSRAPGNGIVGDTIQYHGPADRYALSGARSVATLYSDATTATSNPAVTLRDVGTSGGQAAAFTYDLARSVVYTRQGNPGWSGQERDGTSPIRSDDLYFGAAAADPRPDWVDLSKVSIPQADEQQRLLTNLILLMNQDRKPLPRLWFLPRGVKAAVVMTGDDHGNGGTAGRFDQFTAASPAGCSVANWECIRGTSYVYPSTPLTNTQVASYNAQGFEIGLHLSTNCQDYTPSSLRANYTDQLGAFASTFPGVPAPTTNRTHCIAWSDWSTQATVEHENGIRLDTNYYYWPPSWNQNRPGFFTGSGMPMRFTDTTGIALDVYQAASQMTDESGQSYPYTVDSLLDRATGPEGYYGVFTINANTDVAQVTEATTTVTSAKARGVPVVSAKQMLTWLDGRNASSVQNISWNAGQLSFTAPPAAGANGLEVMVPATSRAGTLVSVTLDGAPVTVTNQTVKGIAYGFVRAASGTFVATYQQDTTPPTVTSTSPAGGATGVAAGATVTATFSEDLDSDSVDASTVTLRSDSTGSPVAASVTYDAASRTARLTPSAPLQPSATYRATLAGGTTDPAVKDLVGNRLTAEVSWTFTTAAGPVCPCSIWASSATPVNQVENDPNAVELGVRFRSDVAGYVTGVRFWKGSANNGTHTGNLWSTAGTRLATATFTGESSSGWQQVTFPSPVAVTAGTTYVASYHTTSGNYAGDNGAFTPAGVDNGPLHALRDGLDGANGVYRYGSSAFPDQTYRSSNYWVDVVLSTAPPADTTPPTVTTTTPANGATGVAVTAPVTAVFSEPVDPASVSGSTMTLTGPAGAVAATVAYDAGSRTATLTPSAPLANATPFTVTVKGGATDPRVKDAAGNALAADRIWSFTTVAAPPAAPTALTAAAGASGVTLDWADNTDAGLAGYAVYRATAAGGPFTRITPVTVAGSTWEDTLARAGTCYYRVTALGAGGVESSPSTAANAAMAKANRIANPGFEVDANADGRPDSWTSSARFTRTVGSARSDAYGGRHNATTNVGYAIGQTRTGLTAGTAYDFAGWVNIPATTDAFTFRFNIVWRNSSNVVIATQTVRTLSGPTSGWVKVAGSYTAPVGTTRAAVNMVLTSLNATVDVDDLSFR